MKLIAEAIHYAHQQGILHRDLKPSNVLIDAAMDQPRITDFGLAKRLDGESSLTMTGQVLGSPNFMPPEQASAQRGKVGRHSDVYGLGGILYHLLTARPPFHAESLEGIVTQVLSAEAISPRLLNASVPRDLDTICLKCLEKEPSRRYQTAQELSDELHRFSRDEPILARPVTRHERVWRWCRRHSAIASLAAATSLLVLLVAIGSPIAALRIHRERQRSDYNASESRQRLVRLNVANGNRLVEEGDLLGALPWYVEAMKLEQSDPAREQMHRARIESVLQQSPRIVQLWYQPSFTGPGLLPQVSSNGRYLLFDDRIKSAGGIVETEVRVVDVTTGEPVFAPFKVEGFVYAKDMSPDARRFVLASGSPKAWLSGPGEARIWDAATGAPATPPLQHSGAVENALFSPDGRHLLTVERSLEPAEETRARIWNAETGAPVTPALIHAASRRLDRFSPDGQRVITVTTLVNSPGYQMEVRVWNVATGETVQPAQVHAGVWSYDLSPDAQRLLVQVNEGARPGPLMVWDVMTGHPISPRWRPREQILGGHFSPDSTRIIVTTRKSLQVWDAASGLPLSAPVKHRNEIRQVRFSPDSLLVISTSVDETARVLDAASGELACPPLLHDFAAHSGSFTTKADTVLTRTANQVTRLWKLRSNAAQSRTLNHTGPVRCAEFSRDGQRVLTASVDGTARLWDAATGAHLKTFSHEGAVMDAAFSSDAGSWSRPVRTEPRASGMRCQANP